jgi:hypothetical protein
MSIVVKTPTISLTPVPQLITTVVEPVSMVPVVNNILLDPLNIYYDPFRTFGTYMPGSLAYYVSYPDLNTDVDMQRKMLNKIWNKLESKWIFEFTKVFKYITGSKGDYKLVTSLKDYESNPINTAEYEDKAEWYLSNIFKKAHLAGVIEKYRKNTSLDWWNVDKNMDHLKAFIYHQMKRRLFERLA